MKIAIVGAGAIGGLLGALLTKSGQDVLLVDTWTEHVEAINKNGLIVVNQSSEEIVKVRATTTIADAGMPDLIIFSVKAYYTEQAAKDCLKIVGPGTTILTVQNGVGNVDKIGAIIGRQRIIAGTTSLGCTVLGPGKIKPSGISKITIGELDGATTLRLENIVDTFKSAGIEACVTDSVDNLIWSKLVVNVGINALTAITLLRNGELLEHSETARLLAMAVTEATEVADKRSIKFLVDDPIKWVMDVAKSTYDNKSSMRQDVERGVKTEIDFINGAIVDEGVKLGVATPVNEVLTLLVKSIEKRNKQII